MLATAPLPDRTTPGEHPAPGCSFARRLEAELSGAPVEPWRVGVVLATTLSARGFWADEAELARLAEQVADAGASSEVLARALGQLGFRCEPAV